MRQKNIEPTENNQPLEESATEPICHHLWVIREAHGPTSQGRCRLCGTTKEFLNSPAENIKKK